MCLWLVLLTVANMHDVDFAILTMCKSTVQWR